jgi:acyl carrier protein
VPTVLSFVDEIPRTPNGKTDWKALPPPLAERTTAEFVAPRTELERTMAGIFAALLFRDQVGVHESFFELGGHSLLAMQLVSRVAAAIQVTLPLQRVFETPTVAGLAAAVGEIR